MHIFNVFRLIFNAQKQRMLCIFTMLSETNLELKNDKMKNLNYSIDGTTTTTITFFETLRMLTQYKSKKVTDYSEFELQNGIEIDGYLFQIN